jgi:hypothetical protein
MVRHAPVPPGGSDARGGFDGGLPLGTGQVLNALRQVLIMNPEVGMGAVRQGPVRKGQGLPGR